MWQNQCKSQIIYIWLNLSKVENPIPTQNNVLLGNVQYNAIGEILHEYTPLVRYVINTLILEISHILVILCIYTSLQSWYWIPISLKDAFEVFTKVSLSNILMENFYESILNRSKIQQDVVKLIVTLFFKSQETNHVLQNYISTVK